MGVEDERLGNPDWSPGDPKWAPYAEALVERAERIMAQRTNEEWLAIFDKHGVPAGPFRFTQELIDDPQVLANDLQVTVEHSLAGTVKMAGPPLQMSETPLAVQGPSPALGQHTDEILASIGYSEERIASLREGGVVR
jgi:formyl-CoA transferase